MVSKFDVALSEILTENKNYVAFFDTLFGFLSRRSDFYVIAKGPEDQAGLPEGYAERIIYESYKKHKPRMVCEDPPVPAMVSEEICDAESDQSHEEPTTDLKTTSKISSSGDRLDTYNGKVFDTYSWSQTISDVDVTIRLPKTLTSKEVVVNYTTDSLRVTNKTNGQIIMSGSLHDRTNVAETFWSIDRHNLLIHFEKKRELWWTQFFTNEPPIDTKDIDCTKPVEDLCDGTRATIEKIQYENEQKMKGLSSGTDEVLRKAWNADGSPFAGMPYNPDAVKFVGQ